MCRAKCPPGTGAVFPHPMIGSVFLVDGGGEPYAEVHPGVVGAQVERKRMKRCSNIKQSFFLSSVPLHPRTPLKALGKRAHISASPRAQKRSALGGL